MVASTVSALEMKAVGVPQAVETDNFHPLEWQVDVVDMQRQTVDSLVLELEASSRLGVEGTSL